MALLGPLLITTALALVGWFVLHLLSARRDRANKKRELRVGYLIEAHRRLESCGHRGGELEAAKLESAVADVQLFGTPQQVKLVQTVVSEFARSKEACIDALLQDLRHDLRAAQRGKAMSRQRLASLARHGRGNMRTIRPMIVPRAKSYMIVLLLHKKTLILARTLEGFPRRFALRPGYRLTTTKRTLLARAIRSQILAEKVRRTSAFQVVPIPGEDCPGTSLTWTDFYDYNHVLAIWRDNSGYVVTPMSGCQGLWWIPAPVGSLNVESATEEAGAALRILLDEEPKKPSPARRRRP